MAPRAGSGQGMTWVDQRVASWCNESSGTNTRARTHTHARTQTNTMTHAIEVTFRTLSGDQACLERTSYSLAESGAGPQSLSQQIQPPLQHLNTRVFAILPIRSHEHVIG